MWAVTYNSHMKATGTGLALYRIDAALRAERMHVHNGTHANRFVHTQSNLAVPDKPGLGIEPDIDEIYKYRKPGEPFFE